MPWKAFACERSRVYLATKHCVKFNALGMSTKDVQRLEFVPF